MKTTLFLGLSAAIATGLAGCGAQPPATPPANTPTKVSEQTPPVATDEHPHEGPHGGSLIEFGDEKYHGELVHDEKAGTVTVYILDGTAKKSVPIDAAEVTINLKHDGNAEQFKLAAKADAGDPEGKSSRFVSDEKELAEDLDHEGAEPQLVVEIEGNQYRGKIEHDHDHDHAGHKHESKEPASKPE